MSNRRLQSILVVIISLTTIALAAGCGSATAPPVELPAPVVGKISISPPDENGQSTITGSAGAVTGGAGVLAINERLSTTSMMWKLTDELVPHAYAAVEDCAGPGRYVTVASVDGSFVLIVDAQVGDNIILVLIDEECVEISERITLVVPDLTEGATPVEEAGVCDGLNVSGKMMDIVYVEGLPIAGFEGNGDVSNTITAGGATMEISGCFCRDMAIVYTASSIMLVVISDEDRLLWVADIVSNTIQNPRTFQLPFIPRAIEDITNHTDVNDFGHVAIVSRGDNAPIVRRVSLTDGSFDPTTDVIVFNQATGHTLRDVFGIRTSWFNGNPGGYLGAIVVETEDTNFYTDYLIYFFQSANFVEATYSGSGPSNITDLATGMQSIADITFARDVDSSWFAYLLVSDDTFNLLRIFSVMYDSGGIPAQANFTNTPSDFTDAVYLVAPNAVPPPATVTTPRRFASVVEPGSNTGAVFTLVNDASSSCNMWRLRNFINPATPPDPNNNCVQLSGASDYEFIQVDITSSYVFIGDDGLDSILSYDNIWFP